MSTERGLQLYSEKVAARLQHRVGVGTVAAVLNEAAAHRARDHAARLAAAGGDSEKSRQLQFWLSGAVAGRPIPWSDDFVQEVEAVSVAASVAPAVACAVLTADIVTSVSGESLAPDPVALLDDPLLPSGVAR